MRRAKWKLRSGRMVISVGIGVPGVYIDVRALNSCVMIASPRGGRLVRKGGGEGEEGGGKVLYRNRSI